uniref:MarR family winged helix-turn-helix transcriptional regulator n=1 Tax=Sphingomonas bacterium TaxID=1895847 RepID=UPI0026377B44|nr:MarR family winged helix-turn-helix transcriptional regulator [Sphingomonas bacterium]
MHDDRRMAGHSLERALFPLLVLVAAGADRRGRGRVGRDYTTVSRQVARLEELGLVSRRPGAVDRRVREAIITVQGKTATDAVDAARERASLALFGDWERKDFDELVRLMRKLSDEMTAL